MGGSDDTRVEDVLAYATPGARRPVRRGVWLAFGVLAAAVFLLLAIVVRQRQELAAERDQVQFLQQSLQLEKQNHRTEVSNLIRTSMEHGGNLPTATQPVTAPAVTEPSPSGG